MKQCDWLWTTYRVKCEAPSSQSACAFHDYLCVETIVEGSTAGNFDRFAENEAALQLAGRDSQVIAIENA